ncbi:DUF2877 domain-containing protein [Nocardioides KLBMP 9356]|uniref:DUF2877 domain-containing protein n=1 Tax=Nocardioides potassii TaxID=2911371 RepID=A0ABS9HHM8_9ACTN|nr:DUF2877 domain-containing protein [Nocardioides potassii]MCF6379846.1 DUF2877 domain-containing protein [Nocardioides potassii]
MIPRPVPRQVPVAAPSRVHQRLLDAADGPREVLHASATAIYVDLDGWCLGLVSATATRVPCALWSTLPDLTPYARSAVAVRDGSLHVGRDRMRVTRLSDPRSTAVGRHEPSASAVPMTSAFDLPADGRLTAVHLDRLLGRGPGLTPLGDDVLAGWFTTRAALGAPDASLAGAVRRRLGVTTLLSATLLDCAIRGEALPQLTAWLADPSPATRRALLAVGATSGAGLLTGASLALASVSTDIPGRAA